MAATVVEKAFCVLELAKTNSVTPVQRHFRRPPPTSQSIYDWNKKFQETGCLCKGKSSGRPPVSDETVELDYRIDICRVTKGSHIEHLSYKLRHINLKTCTTKPCKYFG